MYCTPFNRVIALDPETGRERWAYDPKVRRTSERPYRCRGVAYAEVPQDDGQGACRHRIYTVTGDRRLIAIDARDGRPCAGFGERGVVTLAEHERYGLEEVGSSSPPLVANGVVVVGSSVIDFAFAEAPRGVVAAYDAATGAPRWTFDPLQGATGTGAANAWAPMAADAERDLVFVPTGAPSPDYYGALRVGSNGYANSVVALRLSTGEVEWAFQLVHHDLWDYDTPAQPVLFEWRGHGRPSRSGAGAGEQAGLRLRARPPRRQAAVPGAGASRPGEHDPRREGVADAAVPDAAAALVADADRARRRLGPQFLGPRPLSRCRSLAS